MKSFLLILVLSTTFIGFGQHKKFDQLEMLFDQGHYRKVYRKANSLLDKPEYDFSMLPAYYKGISLIQLAQNDYWRKKHPNALTDAKNLLLNVRKDASGSAIFTAHMHELEWVKSDLVNWSSDLKRMKELKTFEQAQDLLSTVFDGVIIDVVDPGTEIDTNTILPDISIERKSIIDIAEKQLGVPYVWAGNTPEGFDCSGFTSYVYAQLGKELPRRAADQYSSGTIIKEKNVRPGDLVFFNNGSGISHVGIVVSNPGEPLKMIHSASSKGIIVTDVSASEYWKNRLHGFATYVK